MKSKSKFLLSAILTLTLGFTFSVNTKVNADTGKSTKASTMSGDVVQKVGADGEIDWSKGVIRVTGSGAPPDKGNAAQKRLMAKRAALSDARRQLLEVINGVHVSSETVVKDFVTESDVIKTKVEGVLQGAQQIGDEKYMSDGSVDVIMEVSLYGKNSLASVVMPEEVKKIKKDDEPDTKLEAAPIAEEYTSVIVDCKGLGVQPAMSPSIKDFDGGEVYIGDLPIDPDQVINEGIVAYAYNMGEAKKVERAGSKPLIIKASKVIGGFKADVVISNSEAKKLLGADAKSSFLKDFKVIFAI